MLIREHGLILQHDVFNVNEPCGGDSSRSTGTMAVFGSLADKMVITKHYLGDGLMCRNPYQKKWNDPKNFSRDQTIPLVAGFAICKDDHILKEIFYAHLQRFFFCQNLDLSTPALILQMILGARLKSWYWFYPIGMGWHLLEIVWNTKVMPWNEKNQIMCQCKQFGTENIYKKLHPAWKVPVSDYWWSGSGWWRDQFEIGKQIVDNF